jgi:hypothetical protein
MEYPNTRLTRPIRRAILGLFIASFFIISPLIVMYTQGYRYDWQNGRRREIGAVSIDVEPIDANANLGGVEIKSGMPIRLNNITPRKYHLKISASGYYDWNKDIEVQNKQTVYIKEIGLLKKNNPQIITTTTVDDLYLSSDSALLAGVNGRQVMIFNTQNNSMTKIFSDKKTESLAVAWSKKGHRLLITDKVAPFDTAMIIDADNFSKKIDLTTESAPITKIQWSDDDSGIIYYSTEKEIRSLNPITGNSARVATNKYVDWYMEGGALWTMQTASNTQNLRIVKDTAGFASDLSIIDTEVLPADFNNLSIVTGARGQILLKNASQSLMYLVAPQGTYKIAANDYLISPYNNWWLFWTPWELITYSEGGEPMLLNRSGEGLKQVVPLDKYNTLALSWNKNTTALFPYYLVTDELIKSAVRSFEADSVNHILYFSGKYGDSDGVWKLNY